MEKNTKESMLKNFSIPLSTSAQGIALYLPYAYPGLKIAEVFPDWEEEGYKPYVLAVQ